MYFLKDDGSSKKRMFNILMALKYGYETGDFEAVEPFLTDESIFESQWVLEPLIGKTDIMHYLRGKGQTLKKYNALAIGDFIVYPGGVFLRLSPKPEDTENEPTAVVAELDEEGMAAHIYLCDINLLVGDEDSADLNSEGD